MPVLIRWARVQVEKAILFCLTREKKRAVKSVNISISGYRASFQFIWNNYLTPVPKWTYWMNIQALFPLQDITHWWTCLIDKKSWSGTYSQFDKQKDHQTGCKKIFSSNLKGSSISNFWQNKECLYAHFGTGEKTDIKRDQNQDPFWDLQI